jgi:hypothetical protein
MIIIMEMVVLAGLVMPIVSIKGQFSTFPVGDYPMTLLLIQVEMRGLPIKIATL